MINLEELQPHDKIEVLFETTWLPATVYEFQLKSHSDRVRISALVYVEIPGRNDPFPILKRSHEIRECCVPPGDEQ